MRICDDAFWIKETKMPQTVTARTGAHRVVKRKKPRFELRQGVRADRARKFRGEQMFMARVHFDRERAAVGMAQRRFKRFRDALLQLRANFKPVDDDFDSV